MLKSQIQKPQMQKPQIQMQIKIKIPYTQGIISITGTQLGIDYDYKYMEKQDKKKQIIQKLQKYEDINQKQKQKKQRQRQVFLFFKQVQNKFNFFKNSINGIKLKGIQEFGFKKQAQTTSNNFNFQDDQFNQNMLQGLRRQGVSWSRSSSFVSQSQNLNQNQQHFSKDFRQAIQALNKKLQSVKKLQSEIVNLNKQLKENQNDQSNQNDSDRKKQEIVNKQSRIKQIKNMLSRQMKNFTNNISEVVSKNQTQKINRKQIKKDYMQKQIIQTYLVHQLSVQKNEIDQLGEFNRQILKQLYLCGSGIGDDGLKKLAKIEFPKLKILDLQFNSLTKIQPISKFNHLQELYLGDCECTHQRQSMNLIIFDEACQAFTQQVKWMNLKCLSINFCKKQQAKEKENNLIQTFMVKEKCWQPELIEDFLLKKQETIKSIQKIEYWCSKCIKDDQVIKNKLDKTVKYFKEARKIQLTQLD